MLKNLFRSPHKESKQIEAFRKKCLDEALEKVPRLKRLINKQDSGWPEFVEILNDYKEMLSKRKAITSLDTADDATITELKRCDHEKYILNFIIGSVEKWTNKIEKRVLDEKRRESEETRKRLYGR